MSETRARAIAGLKAGDTFEVRRTFTEADIRAFAEVSRDFNPVHLDRRFTEAKGLRDLVCHGLLVASLITEVGGQIGWLAAGVEFAFRKPVFVGDTVTCRITLVTIDERGRARGDAVYTNQDGVVVLEARLGGVIPGREERRVMQDMVEEGDPTNPLSLS